MFCQLGVNITIPTPVAGQNCVSNSSNSAILDKSLVTAPSWSSVQQDLRWMFLLHTYGFACLFFVLGFYTFFSILNLRYVRIHLSTILANIYIYLEIVSFYTDLSYRAGRSCPRLIYSYVYSERREQHACS